MQPHPVLAARQAAQQKIAVLKQKADAAYLTHKYALEDAAASGFTTGVDELVSAKDAYDAAAAAHTNYVQVVAHADTAYAAAIQAADALMDQAANPVNLANLPNAGDVAKAVQMLTEIYETAVAAADKAYIAAVG